MSAKLTLPLAGLLMCLAISAAAQTLDLDDPADALEAYAKMRCSLDSETSIAWWYGTLFADQPGSAPQALMKFEGFNACRIVKLEDGGYRLLTREVMYYKDLETGKILEKWDNPFTEQTVEVVPVANDPVNGTMGLGEDADYQNWPWRRVEGELMLAFNVPLDYPNPLQPDEFPDASSGERYRASEHFTFSGPTDEALDPETKSVPVRIGWTRTGPWLPWMKMGAVPGGLVYVGHGKKLMSGYDALPEAIKAYTNEHYPKYSSAPETYVQPNATSWTEYRKMMRERR